MHIVALELKQRNNDNSTFQICITEWGSILIIGIIMHLVHDDTMKLNETLDALFLYLH